MKSITVRNYRCFGDVAQTAELAPLTLFVGENSSGKTSLMAMLRILWDVAYGNRLPDFKEAPYDLGRFADIAHTRGPRGGRADFFEGSFNTQFELSESRGAELESVKFGVTFGEQWSAPVPVTRYIRWNGHEIIQFLNGEKGRVEIASPSGRWKLDPPGMTQTPRQLVEPIEPFMDFEFLIRSVSILLEVSHPVLNIESLENSPDLKMDDIQDFIEIILDLIVQVRYHSQNSAVRPFAAAPVRAEPQRTHDLGQLGADSHGNYIPTYLAKLEEHDTQAWEALKARLDDFGQKSGLFDEIRVHRFSKTGVGPFQVQVRKFGKRTKGSFRGLVNMGYGISQVLPVAVELLRDSAPQTLLLQQPEVHLHPSAQAELGSLLCQVAGNGGNSGGRQLIVETHSDYIIDRVRMSVVEHAIKPEDVSMVYFERDGLEVFLHSLSVDEFGNIHGAPQGYRQFFLDELQRSVGY